MGGVASGRVGDQLGVEGEVACQRMNHWVVAVGLASCHRFNFVHLPNLSVAVLTNPGTSDCGLIWKQGHCITLEMSS